MLPWLLQRAGRGGRAFLLGWLAGFSHWLLAVSWVPEVLTRYGHLSGWSSALAWALMSAILASFWGLTFWAALGFRGFSQPLVLALGLSFAEVVQGLPPFNFPWNPLAAALVPWPWTLQALPVLGTALFGLLFRWAVLAAATACLTRSARALWPLAACAVTLVAAAWLAPSFRPTGEPLSVAALQPNVPLEMRWEAANVAEIEARVWRLSQEAAGKARWLVWPESAVPRLLERDLAFRQELVGFARERDRWLVLNSIGFGAEGTYFNSMYAVSPAGEVSRYDKVHLVPFGEYVPWVGRLAFLRPLVREVGGFTPGAGPSLLPGPVGPFAPAVCYEVAFPLHVAAQVRQGARVLVTVTNDGWYGQTAAPHQHLALAILRAVESRRYLVRAANTGISAIVDPQGRVLSRLDVGEQGVVLGQVQAGVGVTPAARVAPVLHGLPAAAFGVAILARLRRRREAGF